MFKLTSTFKNEQPKYSTNMHLFDRVVKPVMLYGADIWGFKGSTKNTLYSIMKADIMENCHMKFSRFVLGVNKKAPNIGIYGDTGRFPVCLDAIIAFVKFWHRVANAGEDNKLLYNAYKDSITEQNLWYQSISNLLNRVNLTPIVAARRNVSFITSKIISLMKNDFIDGWKSELLNDTRIGNFGNKLRSYRTYKQVFMQEPYLTESNNSIVMKNLARLRLSAHKLHIETGRYKKGTERLKPEDRKCSFCNSGSCEDEFHFLIKCDFYSTRNELFNKLNNINSSFVTLTDKEKFNYIMSSKIKYIINLTGNFIIRSFKLRIEGTSG